MLENQTGVIQVYKILDIPLITVKRSIREKKLTTKCRNKRTMERDRIHGFS